MGASLQNKQSTLDFLGTIGTRDRGDDLKANETIKAMFGLAGFLIDTAAANLQRGKNVATGETIKSMQIVNVDLAAPSFSLEVEILKTYKFLDQGVKGVGGKGRGKFQFKTRYVSKKMATAILKWITKRNIRASGYPTKYGAYGQVEQKDIHLKKQVDAAKSMKSLAYGMSAKIKRDGIEPTYFMTKAIEATRKETKKRLAAALKVDIINSLN